MLLKTKVKVGNITNLSDARYCAGMGVDLLGFPIGNGSNQITIETFQEIAEWVSGPEFVLEYSQPMDDQILEKVTQIASIKHIQLNTDHWRLSSILSDKSIILESTLDDWICHQDEWKGLAISFLILKGNLIEDIEKFREINGQIPLLVPYNQIQSQALDIFSLPISGIVLEGSAEDRPGHKDYDHLAEVLESLEVD